jgi:hypothetical protein
MSKPFLWFLLLFSFGFTLGEAQQTGKVHRIGMLVSGSIATHGNRINAFRSGLNDLGYVERERILRSSTDTLKEKLVGSPNLLLRWYVYNRRSSL